MRRLWPTRSVIGVDIGSRWVKAAQLTGGPAYTLASSALYPRIGRDGTDSPVPDADELPRLRAVLNRRGFVGNRVVVAAPNALAYTAVMSLPDASSGAPLDQIAKGELARSHKLGQTPIESAWWALPPSSRNAIGHQAMATALACDTAAAIVEAFDRVGLDVIAIDSPPCATRRAGLLNGKDSNAGVVLVDLGWTAARFTLSVAGVVAYHRQLDDLGLRALFEGLHEHDNMSLEAFDAALPTLDLSEGNPPTAAHARIAGACGPWIGRLATETRAMRTYAAHQYPEHVVADVSLVSTVASVPGLARKFSEHLGADAHAQPVVSCVATHMQTARDAQSPALTTAVGLAAYEWIDG
ncbi:MAG: hypothetical protein GC164_15010 [Phycisphaera sp.]|nr:hypothetical protein [Phycisphaera sp.]